MCQISQRPASLSRDRISFRKITDQSFFMNSQSSQHVECAVCHGEFGISTTMPVAMVRKTVNALIRFLRHRRSPKGILRNESGVHRSWAPAGSVLQESRPQRRRSHHAGRVHRQPRGSRCPGPDQAIQEDRFKWRRQATAGRIEKAARMTPGKRPLSSATQRRKKRRINATM